MADTRKWCRHYAVVTVFVVDENARRSGMGHVLMAQVENAARARGCTHTDLSSSMRRPVVHMFYSTASKRCRSASSLSASRAPARRTSRCCRQYRRRLKVLMCDRW
ncbi:GNAT family N-acetyltransferase [Duganella sp. Root1480D1]|uniref:GNAT family N-acetyltransferase n=1 Tax=Duganella sp. Root1480D1 TaxID=1736471 RepID=UPI0009E8FDE5